MKFGLIEDGLEMGPKQGSKKISVPKVIHKPNKYFKEYTFIEADEEVHTLDIIEHRKLFQVEKVTGSENFKTFNPSIFYINGHEFQILKYSNFNLCNGILKRRYTYKMGTYIYNKTFGLKLIRLPVLKCGRGQLSNVIGFEDLRFIGILGQDIYIIGNALTGYSCQNEMYLIKIKTNKLFEMNTRSFGSRSRSSRSRSRSSRSRSRSLSSSRSRSSRSRSRSSRSRSRSRSSSSRSRSSSSKKDHKISFIYPSFIKKLYRPQNIEPKDRLTEKNWMGFFKDNTLYFIYSINPYIILRYSFKDNKCIEVYNKTIPSIKLDYFRCNTSIVKWSNYLLGALHTKYYELGSDGFKHAVYNNYFVLLSDKFPFKIITISRAFKFKSVSYTNFVYISNLYSLKNNDVIVCFGIDDCSPEYVKISSEALKKFISF
jgi:hypothetical protein